MPLHSAAPAESAFLLKSGKYPDLEEYVAAFSQVIKGRAMVDRAYAIVLQEALYPAQSRAEPDRRVADNRVQVVEKLRHSVRE